MTDTSVLECATPSKKSNHQANIVRISSILPHNNADKLELILIDGYQCVVQKGSFKPGDLAVYIQPDSVVPQTKPFEFIWGQYVTDPATAYVDEISERRRRITVRKFRGQWSEGLLLPLSDFTTEELIVGPYGNVSSSLPVEGEDVSERLGITHWNPDAEIESTRGTSSQAHAPKRKRPKTLKGWFYFILSFLGFRHAHKLYTQDVDFKIPVYDVESFKNHATAFNDGDMVLVTEKIHGSNARFICIDGILYAGSRNLWKSPDSNCVWRKALTQNPWIEAWCRAHEGFALYGEVTPTQKGFNYGTDRVQFFAFDVLSPAGEWLTPDEWRNIGLVLDDNTVPVIWWGPFNKDYIASLADGPSYVEGANHIREGVVVKSIENRHVRGLGRLQLKVVSNAFLEKDSK